MVFNKITLIFESNLKMSFETILHYRNRLTFVAINSDHDWHQQGTENNTQINRNFSVNIINFLLENFENTSFHFGQVVVKSYSILQIEFGFESSNSIKEAVLRVSSTKK